MYENCPKAPICGRKLRSATLTSLADFASFAYEASSVCRERMAFATSSSIFLEVSGLVGTTAVSETTKLGPTLTPNTWAIFARAVSTEERASSKRYSAFLAFARAFSISCLLPTLWSNRAFADS